MKNSCLIISAIVVVIFCCQSCNENKKSNSVSESDTTLKKDAPTIDSPDKNSKPADQFNVQQNNEIKLLFAKDSNSLTVKGHLAKSGSTVTSYLAITGSRKLTGVIIPEKQPANIRFNQIIFPDGNADGPFGQKLEYTLKQTGTYKIIIGHSMMADDPYIGDFILQFGIK